MDEWYITEAMIVYGGSFVQGLGRLYRQADAGNKLRLVQAFPEYFKQYGETARSRATELGYYPGSQEAQDAEKP